jgi:hypothetical protein
MKFLIVKSAALTLALLGQAAATDDTSDDCPEGQVKCGAFDGYDDWYCTSVCCDIMTEHTCYNETNTEALYCAKISEGGCPCQSGQVRCEVSQYSIGYCTDVCCDWEVEETCYNPRTRRTKCARINEGGCKHQSIDQIISCNPDTEETCYDDKIPTSCAPIHEGW